MQECCGSALQDQGHHLYLHPVFSVVANTVYMDNGAIFVMMSCIYSAGEKFSPVTRISDKQEKVVSFASLRGKSGSAQFLVKVVCARCSEVLVLAIGNISSLSYAL